MPEQELKTLGETIAELEKLPELHLARVWLNAIKAIAAEELEVEILDGPEEYDSLVWESVITVGALSDGKPRFHAYPAGTAADDLASRDAALKSIAELRGRRGAAAELIALAARMPSTTFAVLARAHVDAQDGPPLVGFYRHPSVARADAVGWLKLTADFIRQQEKDAVKNG